MNFNNDKAIYIQIADRLCDEILAGTYQDDERIPSVREYAVLLQVNTNTAVKAYDELARSEIIYNKRGLPEMFRHMQLLGIDISEIGEEWNRFSEKKS